MKSAGSPGLSVSRTRFAAPGNPYRAASASASAQVVGSPMAGPLETAPGALLFSSLTLVVSETGERGLTQSGPSAQTVREPSGLPLRLRVGKERLRALVVSAEWSAGTLSSPESSLGGPERASKIPVD